MIGTNVLLDEELFWLVCHVFEAFS
jgi:hypothetical protein